MSNIDYTLWPNVGGTLGQNKVQIPDGVTTTWPAGDALVHNFVYQNGKLVGFVDTKALIANDSKTTTFPYDYVNIQLDKSLEGVMTFNGCAKPEYLIITYTESGNSGDTITLKYKGCSTVEDVKAVDPNYLATDIIDGVWSEGLGDLMNGYEMFYGCTALTSFTSNLSSLTDGYYMFYNCSNLTTFTSDLSSLTKGTSMFFGCSNLTTFTSDSSGSPVILSSLTDGYYMFQGCTKLSAFTSDLSSLTKGTSMFSYCKNLTTFTSDLSSLTSGGEMFRSCTKLTTFTSDLSSLTYGSDMFNYCSNLTTFTSNLSSLTDGKNMFLRCKLDTNSIKNIAETINTVTNSPKFHISIGNTTPTTEENTYLTQIHNKGWQVYVNGSTSGYIFTPMTTTDETGETQEAPIPFWAKPVPSDEKSAEYVDADGNFYNILGAQFIYVDDPETYGMFTCEEDAAVQMCLTKIERN